MYVLLRKKPAFNFREKGTRESSTVEALQIKAESEERGGSTEQGAERG